MTYSASARIKAAEARSQPVRVSGREWPSQAAFGRHVGADPVTVNHLFGNAPESVGWTITNPPFRLAEQFVARMLETSERGCAVIVRSAFLEGIGRFDRLFSQTPPTDILQFTERVVMHKGKLSATASTATAYCWLVWRKCTKDTGTRFHWIAPCRRQLERTEDYA